MAKQFKVTRKDGSSHIVPEAALDAIKRLYKSEGKDLKVEPYTGSETSKSEAAPKPTAPKLAESKGLILAINAATTIEEVNALVVPEDARVTVLAAKDAKIAELNDLTK